MKKNDLLEDDVDLDKLSARTKNYTGAEIEAVCRGATQFALFKDIDMSVLNKREEVKAPKAAQSKKVTNGPTSDQLVEKKVSMADFLQALEENKPAFGVDNENLSNCVRGGIFEYGGQFNEIYKTGMNFVNEIKNSEKNTLLSILLEGKNGSGKTALAAKLALESQFPYIKLVSPENFVGYSEVGKINAIVKVFEDAYKSPLSLIILDDIERLIEFIHIGPRFSNPILQALLVLIKKKPPNAERKLMIIGTTSMRSVLEEMEVVQCFNVCQSVPCVKKQKEIASVLAQFKGSEEVIKRISQDLTKGSDDGSIRGSGIPIKNLILSIEMAIETNSNKTLDYDTFMHAFNSVNHL
jgi:vesicle-fusing ATPase